MSASALVVGGTIEGVQVALDIADSGIDVILIESSPELSIKDESAIYLRPKLLEVISHPNIRILTGVDVLSTGGKRGAFKTVIRQKARYVDPQACVSCGRCEGACPCTILDPISQQTGKAIHRPASGIKSVPSACIVEKKGIAPCVAACPAGTNVQGYVSLISKGKFAEALDLVREALPFPHILGRVCTHPCESACTRGQVDQPIAIASLKRFLADSEASAYGLGYTEKIRVTGPSRVAIIGSGPAGLTCARDLARKGYKSTIFEALPVPGGMVAVGMPRFRLPREVRETEIEAIYKVGIEIRTNSPVGRDMTIEDLRKQGYEAFFVAIGAHMNRKLDIPGEELAGVLDAVTLLREVNLIRDFNVQQLSEIRQHVVVIGGGYTAIDSARTAIRLGCEKVTILYRRTAVEMTATPAEILETTEEGVNIEFLVAPIRILGENGKVVGIECQRMKLGEPDDSGRASPVPIEGSEFIIDTDTVIPAIGQKSDLELLDAEKMGLANDGETIKVDSLTLATNLPGVFAGGDVVYGPRSMVEAVGDGRRAAESIDRFLRGVDLSANRTLERLIPMQVNLDEVKIPRGSRRRIPVLPLKQRKKNFEEVETGYTTFMALREAKRCLSCGGCSECMECVRACELQAVSHDMKPVEIELDTKAVVYASRPEGKFPKDAYIISDKPVLPDLLRSSAIATKVVTDLAEHIETGNAFSMGPEPVEDMEPKVGVFICGCGGNISDVIDIPELLVRFAEHPHTVFAHQIGYACSDEGALEIRNLASIHGLNRVVLAACSCCELDQICFSCSDRKIECKHKLLSKSREDGVSYEFVNIREHCAWVHDREPQKALAKASALIGGALARTLDHQVFEIKSYTVQRTVFVIGTGLAAMQAAADLGISGFTATVLRIGEKPSGDEVNTILQTWQENSVRSLDGPHLDDIQGNAGSYIVTVNQGSQPLPFNVGAIIIDRKAVEGMDLPTILKKAVDSQPLTDQISSQVPGIFLCGSSSRVDEALLIGDAVSARVLAFLNRGEFRPVQTIAQVDPRICRGCGTCTAVCHFGAATLIQQPSGVYISNIDEVKCQGCGTCVAHCPSNAISQHGLTDCQITASMEAMLAR